MSLPFPSPPSQTPRPLPRFPFLTFHWQSVCPGASLLAPASHHRTKSRPLPAHATLIPSSPRFQRFQNCLCSHTHTHSPHSPPQLPHSSDALSLLDSVRLHNFYQPEALLQTSLLYINLDLSAVSSSSSPCSAISPPVSSLHASCFCSPTSVNDINHPVRPLFSNIRYRYSGRDVSVAPPFSPVRPRFSTKSRACTQTCRALLFESLVPTTYKLALAAALCCASPSELLKNSLVGSAAITGPLPFHNYYP